jgi:hypothetical protein
MINLFMIYVKYTNDFWYSLSGTSQLSPLVEVSGHCHENSGKGDNEEKSQQISGYL